MLSIFYYTAVPRKKQVFFSIIFHKDAASDLAMLTQTDRRTSAPDAVTVRTKAVMLDNSADLWYNRLDSRIAAR